MDRSNCSSRQALLLAAAAFLAIASAPAATVTWDGGGDLNWQTPANWVEDLAPTPGDLLVFAGNAGLSNNNNYPAATHFNGLTFATGAGSFSLGGNSLIIDRPLAGAGTALVGGNVTNSSANPQTVELPVTLASGNHTIATAGGAGALNFNGNFGRETGATATFSAAGGNIVFAGSSLSNDASGLLGGWAIMGNNWAELDGSGAVVPYAAYTEIGAGDSIVGGPTLNYRYTGPPGTIFAPEENHINTLSATILGAANEEFNVNIVGSDGTFETPGILKLGSNGGLYRTGASSGGILIVNGGTLTADGGGEISLRSPVTAPTTTHLRVISEIADDGDNPVVVNLAVGSAQLQGPNTYSGGTFVNQGRAQATHLSGFGTGPVDIAPGGHAFLSAGTGEYVNDFIISGIGTTEANAGAPGPGAIRMGGQPDLSGTITLRGNARLASGTSAAPGPLLSGPITGTGTLELTSFARENAIVTLANSDTEALNDWEGGLNITATAGNRQITVIYGADAQIPDHTSVTLAGTSTAALELNGFSDTIGGLNSGDNVNFVVSNLATGTESTLTVGAGDADGDFGGRLADLFFDSTLHLVKAGGGTQILRGMKDYSGTTTVAGGTLELIGPFYGEGVITVEDGATFAANEIVAADVILADGARLVSTGVDGTWLLLERDLQLGSGSSIDIDTGTWPIEVLGTVTPTGAAGSVTLNITGAAPALGEHTLLTSGSLAGAGGSAFTLGTLPSRVEATLSTVGQSLVLNVTSTGDFSVWTGAHSSEWSTNVLPDPKNWVLNSSPGITTDFLSGDTVAFNDSAANTTIDISNGDVNTTGVTFDNNTKDYLITGSHGIAGSGDLTHRGAAVTTLATNNSYTGGTVIEESSVLRVGNGGSSGNLGAGPVLNDGSLIFHRSDAFAIANPIDGFGPLRFEGGGVLSLGSNNVYTGETTIAAGSTIRVTGSNSLGNPMGSVEVEAGGAVDLAGNPANNQNHGAKQFFIAGDGPSGQGALVNSGPVGQLNAFQQVILSADASVGGSGRFDLRGGGPVLDLNGFTLRKLGANQFSLVGATVINGGSILVEAGTFAMETSTTTEGEGSVTFQPHSHAQFFQNTTTNGGITWPLTLRENVAIGNAGGQLATVPANIILEGNAVLVPFTAGVRNPASNNPLLLTGDISESGGSYSLIKEAPNTVTLSGTSSHTGTTTVNAGTLVVDGTITVSPVALASTATLAGIGTVGAAVTAEGRISPGGDLLGLLATGPTTFSAGGSLVVQIDSGAQTSDELAVTGSLDLGGATLDVSDLGAAFLAAGTKLTVATYTGSLTGSFGNLPNGETLTVGPNSFTVNYSEAVGGVSAITLTTVAGTGYNAWAAANGLDGSNGGKYDDPDRDGRPNILEFALNGDPLVAGDDGKMVSQIADVDPTAAVDLAFTITLPVLNGATFSGPGDLVSEAIDGIVYRIQGSTNLVDFTTLDVTEVITEVTTALAAGLPVLDAGWSYRAFRLPGAPGDPHDQAFLRVAVTEPAP